MEDGGLTLIDWIVIVVVGLSAILALFRGFIREVLSLMTWLIAAVVTVNFYDDVKEVLAPHISSKMALLGISTVGLFILVLILLSIINSVIMRFLHAGSDISILDSALGMCFGVVRGLFILSLTYVMFSVIMPKDNFPDMVKHAKTLPLVEYSAGVLKKLAPEYFEHLTEVTEKAKEEGDRMAKEKAEEELRKMKAHESSNYDKDKRNNFDSLLDNLEREGRGAEPETQTPPKESL